ncbi:MAG: murein DD-endopeptidase MepM [Candidatus Malihini olakiniferum]
MQQIVRTIAIAYNNLPRPHRIILGSLSIILIVAIWHTAIYPHTNNTPITIKETYLSTTSSKPIPKKLFFKAIEPIGSEIVEQPILVISADNLDITSGNVSDVHECEHLVSAADTLSSISTQYGANMDEVSIFVKKCEDLRNLKIGKQLLCGFNNDGKLQNLTWQISQYETRIYERGENSFRERLEMQKEEWHNRMINGRLSDHFLLSTKLVDLTDSKINIVKTLQSQFNFRKMQKDDNFSVLLLKESFDVSNEQSELIDFFLDIGNKGYLAIRAADRKFYDREASGLKRGFMRFPTIKQFRVSSTFNLRRLNPVTGRVTPHRGVDFSMPVGTPVLSVGDGEVFAASQGPNTGNYIEIRHSRQYTTRYMHLNLLLVKPGQKVKRGDRIALSGNTGRSTGPHLHYEFWVNQQAVNPLTAKLPCSDGLVGQDRRKHLLRMREITLNLSLD